MAKIDDERIHLDNLKDDHQLFDDVVSDLTAVTRDTLAAEKLRLSQFHDDLIKKEKEMYDRYVSQKDGASSAKDQEETDIKDKREELKADRIYIEDCEKNYEQSMGDIETLSSDELEQLQREKLAIEIELDRIQEEESGLNERESNLHGTFDDALEEIELQRSGDIDILNEGRQKLKELKSHWSSVVEHEIENSADKRSKVMMEYEEKDRLSSNNHDVREIESNVNQQKDDLIDERKRLEEQQRDSENEARRSISKINRMSSELDEKTKREIDKISSRMKA